MLEFKFKNAHIACSINIAADLASRLELEITEKIRPEIRVGMHTTRIGVAISSSDSTDEEQFFFA